MTVLAVIPARGGSKGIPRKNLRPLAGRPLLAWVIAACREAQSVDRVVVSTDSDEIAVVARRHGAEVVLRDPKLAEDAVTLDPVIHDAVLQVEAGGPRFTQVLTVQPTSPLLRPAIIDRVVAELRADNAPDTIITAIDDTHLAWKDGPDGPIPAYEARLNRQQLPARYRETGAVLGAQRDAVQPNSRIGERVGLVVMDALDGIDIDGPDDWLMAEAALSRRRIAFWVIGNPRQGLGHVTRVMTLMEGFSGHHCRIFCGPQQALAIDRLQAAFFPVTVVEDSERMQALARFGPDLVVHDELDTSAEMIQAEQAAGYKVVCFEDAGPGADEADLVFNALYPQEESVPEKGRFFGPSVYCLRPEFRGIEPVALREDVEEILVTFGGTDPARLTYKALDALRRQRCHVTVIAGRGFEPFSDLEERCAVLRAEGMNLTLLRDVPLMSELMRNADLALSSSGRTLYELAALSVPTVALAQNALELKHTFAATENGFIFLGLGSEARPEAIEAAIDSLVQSSALRQSLRRSMQSHDLISGLERVTRAMLELS
jgi:CMP-N-acetylneuraminic acid synthetase/spore coat polysaccharide biosynthesis predicted glycosyltransferase SpsG